MRTSTVIYHESDLSVMLKLGSMLTEVLYHVSDLSVIFSSCFSLALVLYHVSDLLVYRLELSIDRQSSISRK